VDDYLNGKLKVATFCRDVEAAYNEAIDESALTPVEQPIFEMLFDEVVWFSPFPREDWEYPHYRDEAQIRSAAVRASEQLSSI
jgi:hypothetical protein